MLSARLHVLAAAGWPLGPYETDTRTWTVTGRRAHLNPACTRSTGPGGATPSDTWAATVTELTAAHIALCACVDERTDADTTAYLAAAEAAMRDTTELERLADTLTKLRSPRPPWPILGRVQVIAWRARRDATRAPHELRGRVEALASTAETVVTTGRDTHRDAAARVADIVERYTTAHLDVDTTRRRPGPRPGHVGPGTEAAWRLWATSVAYGHPLDAATGVVNATYPPDRHPLVAVAAAQWSEQVRAAHAAAGATAHADRTLTGPHRIVALSATSALRPGDQITHDLVLGVIGRWRGVPGVPGGGPGPRRIEHCSLHVVPEGVVRWLRARAATHVVGYSAATGEHDTRSPEQWDAVLVCALSLWEPGADGPAGQLAGAVELATLIVGS